MRVQTYASWVHPYAALPRANGAPQSPDELDGIIDTLIAQVPYYPSFAVQITRDAQGLLLQGSQRVVQTEEQADGMVVLRTHGGQVWIIQADYQAQLLRLSEASRERETTDSQSTSVPDGAAISIA
jgi:hypothetical protein